MGKVVCIGAEENEYRCFIRRLEGRRSVGDLGVVGRIILKRFVKELGRWN